MGFRQFMEDVILTTRGEFTGDQANAFGIPEAKGMTRDQLVAMMQMQQARAEAPMKAAKAQADIRSDDALTADRTAKANARGKLEGMRKDQFYEQANENMQIFIKANPYSPLAQTLMSDPVAREEFITREIQGGKRAAKATKPTTGGALNDAPKGTAKPSDGAPPKYGAFAEKAGEKIGYNTQTKKWEPVSGK